MTLARLIKHPVLALIVANIIWGAAAPIFKWSLGNIEPFTLAFLRFFIPALFMIPFLSRKTIKIDEKDWVKLLLSSFLGITINIGFFFVALTLTQSINAPIIGSAGSIFLILGSMVILKERTSMKSFLGGVLGFIGVVIIVAAPLLAGEKLDTSLAGNTILLIATLASVGHTIVLKQLMQKYAIFPILFWTFLIGSLTFLPFVFYEAGKMGGFLANLDISGIVGIMFGAVLSSFLAHFLYYAALKELKALDVGMFTYLDPVVAIVIAIPLLGEVPSPTFIIGSTLVFLGIYIAEGRIPWHPLHLFKK